MTKGLMLPAEEVKSKFTVREVEEKGRALFLYSRIIRKDSFVLEYEGDVITHDEAVFREKIYEANDEGCFILFFRFQGRRLAIDATRNFDSYARYLNHSREPNIRFHSPLMLDLTGKGVPRIAAYALKDIQEGEEIVFDYGINDGKISWLRNRKRCHTSELRDSSNEDSTSSSSDNDTTSDRDVVMSIRRTPRKSQGQPSHSSYIPQKTLCLTPSKYLSHGSPSKKPPKLSLPSDGHGIRYIPLPSHSSIRKTYIASFEGLGQPLKIMRSVEKTSKSSQSVISLSASDDDSSKKSPTNYHPSDPPCYTDFNLPYNKEPSSTYKVLEWQESIIDTLPVKDDSLSGVEILQVTSLKEEAQQSSSPSSFSSSKDSYSMQKQPNNSLPCITNILHGNSVPTSFVPIIHSSNYEASVECSEKMSFHHNSISRREADNCRTLQQSPRKLPSHNFSPSSKGYVPHQREDSVYSEKRTEHYAGAVMEKPSLNDQCCVKTSNVEKVSNEQEVDLDMICLSDSDEDLICPHKSDKPISHISHNALSKPEAGQYKQSCTSIQMTDKSRSFCDTGVHEKPKSKNMLQDASSEKDIVPSENFHIVETQTTLFKHRPHIELQHNDKMSISCTRMSSFSENTYKFTKGHEDVKSCDKQSVNNFQLDLKISNVQSYAPKFDNSTGKTATESQLSCQNEVVNIDISDTENETLEIDEQNVIEIISDGEGPSESDHLDKNCAQPSTAPDCEIISSTPHDALQSKHLVNLAASVATHLGSSSRPKPHVAIVKPYSAQNEKQSEEEEKVANGEIRLTQEDKEKMKKIFQPLIQSSDNLALNSVEDTISKNFDFFSVLIGRGVTVNEIRRTVWSLFKMSC